MAITDGDSSKMWLFFLGGGCCSRAQVSYGIRCLSLSRLGLKESAGVPASLVPVGRCIVILRGTQAPETPKRR